MHVRVTTPLVLTLVLYHQLVSSFDFSNVVFIIVSQRDPYNAAIAKRLKQDLENQTQVLHQGQAKVHLTHEDFPVPGDFTIVPLLQPLLNKYRGSDVRWAMFIEPVTAVRCAKLIEVLAAADKNPDAKWIGYPLTDMEPTAIHNFEHENLIYPNFASGFAIRLELMDTILHQLATGQRLLIVEFSVDPSFEFAKLIYGDSKDPGPLLTPDASFCLVPADNCATYQKQTEICGSPIPERSIFFAVKTWSGYHNSRVKAIKKTWGRYATNVKFYSDKADPALPSIETGVPNTILGHCHKTMTILKMTVDLVKSMPHIKWIFLADDDTILGVQRLTEVLSCYKGGSELTILGERYGFGYLRKITSGFDSGFCNFITTGGGAVFSVAAAAKLSKCPCQAVGYPDDMALGECARFNNYTLTHSPLFHQHQPPDYPREILARDKPVSFHHHIFIPPVKVYATWFQRDDLALQQLRNEL